MTSWPLPVANSFKIADAVTGATPLGIVKEGLQYGETMTALSTKIPTSTELFLGVSGGSIGEMSGLALLIGGIYLIVRRVISWHIPVTMLLTMGAMTGIFWLTDPQQYADPLFHLLAGGAILGAFYMATDLVTSPITRKGMVIFRYWYWCDHGGDPFVWGLSRRSFICHFNNERFCAFDQQIF
ncbi:MAG: RnfABCDGE type electron transport complex subunit D [Flavobacteriaceae bacterium]|nr:RnfABCDGE type electron transport complex subunit D [Flavobacteriaceae bacterium]